MLPLGQQWEAAARELDVSVSTVRRWLAGRSDPRYEELWRVLEVFGTVPLCERRKHVGRPAPGSLRPPTAPNTRSDTWGFGWPLGAVYGPERGLVASVRRMGGRLAEVPAWAACANALQTRLGTPGDMSSNAEGTSLGVRPASGYCGTSADTTGHRLRMVEGLVGA